MDIDSKRILVAGATGALGGALAEALAAAGAEIVSAGRHDCDVALDLADPASPAACIEAAGPLDAIVLATGNVAFGAAEATDDAVVRSLFEVNVLGPIALVRAALARSEPPEAIVALSAVVADHPTAGMAAYSAAKGALSAYLTALRHERRRVRTVVLDVRPPHLDTGFETPGARRRAAAAARADARGRRGGGRRRRAARRPPDADLGLREPRPRRGLR